MSSDDAPVVSVSREYEVLCPLIGGDPAAVSGNTICSSAVPIHFNHLIATSHRSVFLNARQTRGDSAITVKLVMLVTL